MPSVTSRPKRDSRLYVARPPAVTLTWAASLSQAKCPGLSGSRSEPSGVALSWFSQSSSRALGPRLLGGQRSGRTDLFSITDGRCSIKTAAIRGVNLRATATLATLGRALPRMGAANRAVKFPQLPVLADGRPRGLEELTAQAALPAVGDRAPLRAVSPWNARWGPRPESPANGRSWRRSRQSPLRARR